MAFPNDVLNKTEKTNDEFWKSVKSISEKLTAYSQAELLQLSFDMRPVAELVVESGTNITIQDLEKQGLFCSQPFNQNERSYSVFVSKTKELAEEARLLNYGTRGLGGHERFGELMGFPKTAIKSFVDEGGLAFTADYPDVFGGYNEMIFGMRISNPPTEEEVAYLVHANRLLLKHAPQIPNQFMPNESAEEYKIQVKAFLDKYPDLK